jgi:hypothetical protein
MTWRLRLRYRTWKLRALCWLLARLRAPQQRNLWGMRDLEFCATVARGLTGKIISI